MMNLQLFRKISNDLDHFDEKVKVVFLYGFGEPLLNPNLFDMIAILKDEGLCRDVRVVTNGVLLNPELNDRLVASGLDLLRVSVEGLSSDDYREICGVEIDYEKFLLNIKDLYIKSRNSNTKISAKIIAAALSGEDDVRRFEEMYREITDSYFVEAEQDYWVGYEVNPRTVDGARTEMISDDGGECSIHPCSYPLTCLTIFADGEVGVCCGDWRKETVVGDVKKEALKKIWNGEKITEIREALVKGERSTNVTCRECRRRGPDDISKDAQSILERLRQH